MSPIGGLGAGQRSVDTGPVMAEVGVGDAAAGDYVAVTPKDTIVPHTTMAGGIAGRSSPYPPIRRRRFDEEQRLVFDEVVQISGGSYPVQPAEQPPEASAEPLPEAPEPAAAPEQPAPAVAAAPSAPPPRKRREPVAVTFRGPFGEITAPFTKVIAGEGCLVLEQDLSEPYGYRPPQSDQDVLELEWRDHGVQQHRLAVNCGISFQPDAGTKTLVLLPAGD